MVDDLMRTAVSALGSRRESTTMAILPLATAYVNRLKDAHAVKLMPASSAAVAEGTLRASLDAVVRRSSFPDESAVGVVIRIQQAVESVADADDLSSELARGGGGSHQDRVHAGNEIGPDVDGDAPCLCAHRHQQLCRVRSMISFCTPTSSCVKKALKPATRTTRSR